MKKAEIIERYGEAEYARVLERCLVYYETHKEEHRERRKAASKNYRETHPEEIRIRSHEQGRKGGRRYAKNLVYKKTGIPGKRNRIRRNHARQYKPYKDIIAPGSQIHHEWIPTTSEYRGVALVEAEAHIHGFIDVIEILDGKITLLTEEEVRKGEKIEKESL